MKDFVEKIKKKRLLALGQLTIENNRFRRKIAEASVDLESKHFNCNHSKEWASLKRACLDMKNELTKITQYSDYD